MNCSCEVKLPPIEGECLICRMPVEEEREAKEHPCGRADCCQGDPESRCGGCGGATEGACCEDWCGA